MSDTSDSTGPKPVSTMPPVNALTAADIKACLAQGWADFRKAPFFGLFFGGVFALGGLLIVQSLIAWDLDWKIYAVAIGFPLIGPFAAVGLYEVSRRLQNDESLAWNEILALMRYQSRRELSWMAFVMLFIFWIWMYQVRLLVALFLARTSFGSWGAFLEVVTTTPEGIGFLVVGHLIGAALALILFSVTVVSIPMLLERNVDFVTAMITSVKTVLTSPVVMIGWGIIVTLSVMAAMVPAFLGLLIVLPVLGHTTWHIYKKAVGPQPG